MKLSLNPGCAPFAAAFRVRARKLLEEAHAAGVRDGETALALAELYSPTSPARAREYAREAIEAKGVSAEVRGEALMKLALAALQMEDFAPAREALQKVVLLRRASMDWHLLGICYLMEKQPRKAQEALQRALEIWPYRPHSHEALAQVYRELGDIQRALEHTEKARWLSLHPFK